MIAERCLQQRAKMARDERMTDRPRDRSEDADGMRRDLLGHVGRLTWKGGLKPVSTRTEAGQHDDRKSLAQLPCTSSKSSKQHFPFGPCAVTSTTQKSKRGNTCLYGPCPLGADGGRRTAQTIYDQEPHVADIHHLEGIRTRLLCLFAQRAGQLPTTPWRTKPSYCEPRRARLDRKVELPHTCRASVNERPRILYTCDPP